jgi:hypothetical protein
MCKCVAHIVINSQACKEVGKCEANLFGCKDEFTVVCEFELLNLQPLQI